MKVLLRRKTDGEIAMIGRMDCCLSGGFFLPIARPRSVKRNEVISITQSKSSREYVL